MTSLNPTFVPVLGMIGYSLMYNIEAFMRRSHVWFILVGFYSRKESSCEHNIGDPSLERIVINFGAVVFMLCQMRIIIILWVCFVWDLVICEWGWSWSAYASANNVPFHIQREEISGEISSVFWSTCPPPKYTLHLNRPQMFISKTRVIS